MGAFVNGKFKETYKEYKKNGAYLGGLYVKKGHEKEAYRKVLDYALKKGKGVYVYDIHLGEEKTPKLWDEIIEYKLHEENVRTFPFGGYESSEYDFIITTDLNKYIHNHLDRKPFVLVFPKENE